MACDGNVPDCRLPYEDEVKDLCEDRGDENTLDHWAGTPNPEDAASLRGKIKELSGTAPLLKRVGSFQGQGKEDEEPIYDLGGIVAEWVLTRDGKTKVISGSADCPAKTKSSCTPVPEYIGFRVVRGTAKLEPPAKRTQIVQFAAVGAQHAAPLQARFARARLALAASACWR
jgi:formylglycine-generating enzyme required for sulfatase activity